MNTAEGVERFNTTIKHDDLRTMIMQLYTKVQEDEEKEEEEERASLHPPSMKGFLPGPNKASGGSKRK